MLRGLAAFVFLSTIAISAWRRGQARRAGGVVRRSEEPPALIAGRLLVALPLFGGVLAYLANPRWMDWASIPLPSWARWVGVGLGMLVPASAYWVLTTLGANVSETVLTKPQHALVTSGPYRWVRHPLYTTGIALFASVGLMAANGFILLWTALAAVALRLVVVPREEAHLIAKFGDAYRAYARGVRKD